jgi:hypothetical protein
VIGRKRKIESAVHGCLWATRRNRRAGNDLDLPLFNYLYMVSLDFILNNHFYPKIKR